jgi:hypothetical protein
VSRLSRQCGIFNISQSYRSPRTVTSIAFICFYLMIFWYLTSYWSWCLLELSTLCIIRRRKLNGDETWFTILFYKIKFIIKVVKLVHEQLQTLQAFGCEKFLLAWFRALIYHLQTVFGWLFIACSHTIGCTSFQFDIIRIAEDFSGEVLDTCKGSWDRAPSKPLLHFLFCKKRFGKMTTQAPSQRWSNDNTSSVTAVKQWQH